MNKKLIPTALIMLIILSVFVFANQNSMTTGPNGDYIIEAELVKGWNIIGGTIPSEGIVSDSEIQAKDILAMWYYSPLQKKYIRIHPNTDHSEIEKEDEDNVLTSAMWVYSQKSGKIKYSTLENYPNLVSRQLHPGWNFVTITIDMYNGNYNPDEGYPNEYFSWDSIKGSCNYEKIVFWNPIAKKWFDVASDIQIKSYDFDDFLGSGMLVKVSNNCNFSKPVSSTISPPQIPN